MREIPKDAARPRLTTVARRTGSAHFRKRFCAGLEAVGRPSEDDSERIPSNAVAERSAGTDRAADGGFLLRGQRRVTAWLRSTANQINAGLRDSVPGAAAESAGPPQWASITSRSMTNSNCEWAWRSAPSTAAAAACVAKMNPR